MFGKLILLFIIVPVADLFLLMVLSSYIGWPVSIAIVILSGIVGAYLAKRSYRSVLRTAQTRVASQQSPADLLPDGAMIFFAAGLLLTPGFITDAVGMSLLIPACRRWYKSWLVKWFKHHFQWQIISVGTPGQASSSPRRDGVVEGEVLHREDAPPRPTSGRPDDPIRNHINDQEGRQ